MIIVKCESCGKEKIFPSIREFDENVSSGVVFEEYSHKTKRLFETRNRRNKYRDICSDCLEKAEKIRKNIIELAELSYDRELNIVDVSAKEA